MVPESSDMISSPSCFTTTIYRSYKIRGFAFEALIALLSVALEDDKVTVAGDHFKVTFSIPASGGVLGSIER